MQPLRKEVLTWNDVDKLIDHLLPQFEADFEAMVMITRGGIIPGGMLAEAMGIRHIVTAAVDYLTEFERERTGLFAWPRFIQFPDDDLLRGRRILVVDDVWGSGRTITAVKKRVSAAGGFSWTCVLHFGLERGPGSGDFYRGKLRAAQYFLATELPEASRLLDLCASGEDSYAGIRPEWF